MFCVDVIVREETTEKSHEKFIPWNTHDLFCKNGPVVSGQIKGYKLTFHSLLTSQDLI